MDILKSLKEGLVLNFAPLIIKTVDIFYVAIIWAYATIFTASKAIGIGLLTNALNGIVQVQNLVAEIRLTVGKAVLMQLGIKPGTKEYESSVKTINGSLIGKTVTAETFDNVFEAAQLCDLDKLQNVDAILADICYCCRFLHETNIDAGKKYGLKFSVRLYQISRAVKAVSDITIKCSFKNMSDASVKLYRDKATVSKNQAMEYINGKIDGKSAIILHYNDTIAQFQQAWMDRAESYYINIRDVFDNKVFVNEAITRFFDGFDKIFVNAAKDVRQLKSLYGAFMSKYNAAIDKAKEDEEKGVITTQQLATVVTSGNALIESVAFDVTQMLRSILAPYDTKEAGAMMLAATYQDNGGNVRNRKSTSMFWAKCCPELSLDFILNCAYPDRNQFGYRIDKNVPELVGRILQFDNGIAVLEDGKTLVLDCNYSGELTIVTKSSKNKKGQVKVNYYAVKKLDIERKPADMTAVQNLYICCFQWIKVDEYRAHHKIVRSYKRDEFLKELDSLVEPQFQIKKMSGKLTLCIVEDTYIPLAYVTCYTKELSDMLNGLTFNSVEIIVPNHSSSSVFFKIPYCESNYNKESFEDSEIFINSSDEDSTFNPFIDDTDEENGNVDSEEPTIDDAKSLRLDIMNTDGYDDGEDSIFF